jgi:hypothetical protein
MDAWFFLSFPRCNTSRIAGPEGAKNLAGQKCPPPDSNPFSGVEFGKNLARLSRQFAASVDRGFEFHKSGLLFIGAHNETVPIIAVRVSNPDRSPFGIDG